MRERLTFDTTLPEVWAFCDSTAAYEGPNESHSCLLLEASGALRNERVDALATAISWNWYLPAMRRAAIEQQRDGPAGQTAGPNEIDHLFEDPLFRRCLVPRLRANKFPTSAIVSGNWPEPQEVYVVRTKYDFRDNGSVELQILANDLDVDVFWVQIQRAAHDIGNLL